MKIDVIILGVMVDKNKLLFLLNFFCYFRIMKKFLNKKIVLIK